MTEMITQTWCRLPLLTLVAILATVWLAGCGGNHEVEPPSISPDSSPSISPELMSWEGELVPASIIHADPPCIFEVPRAPSCEAFNDPMGAVLVLADGRRFELRNTEGFLDTFDYDTHVRVTGRLYGPEVISVEEMMEVTQ